MKPSVSIVIATYNDPDVVMAVKSAKEQTIKDKEIILIDDGSDRKVANLILSLETQVDHLIIQENLGQSIARNRGIKRSTGKYILNWDSDDYFESDFCKKAVKKFEAEEDIKIVSCKARRFNKKGEIDVFTPKGGDVRNFLFSNSALGSSMFKKADWEASGGYEENLPILGFEDWEFYIRILKAGGVAHVIPEILFNYQIREGSTTARIRHLRQEKFRHIILKHKELYLDNFEDLIDHLLLRINQAETEILKRETSLNFRTGERLLRPLRKLKSIFK